MKDFIIVTVSELISAEEKITLGYRFVFTQDIENYNLPKSVLLRVDVDTGLYATMFDYCRGMNYRTLKGKPILMFIKGDKYVSNNEYGLSSYNTLSDLKILLREVVDKSDENSKIAKVKADNQYDNCKKLKNLFKTYGLTCYEDDCRSNIIGEFSVRFLGGFNSWSGSEDICDAEILSKEACQKVNKVIKDFNSSSEIFKVGCSSGEKAWLYFHFDFK